MKAGNVTIEPYWPSLFAKLAEKRDIDDLILNCGSGGAAAPAAVAAPAAGGAAQAAAPAAQEKKKVQASLPIISYLFLLLPFPFYDLFS